MSSYPGSPSWVRVVFAPDQKAAFRSAAAVFTDQLIPLIPDVPAAALEGMRGDGVKSAARRAHALELMGSHKDVVPPSVSPERLADAQASVSDIDELLVPLERTVHRLRNYRRQCVHVGDTQVSGFTESARTGARMGQASAQRVVDEMAPYTARKRARKAADGSEVDGEFDHSDDESPNEA